MIVSLMQDEAATREKRLEEAKSIVLEEDKSLPPAERILIRDVVRYRQKRVEVHGWVHRLRRQSALCVSLRRRVSHLFQSRSSLLYYAMALASCRWCLRISW